MKIVRERRKRQPLKTVLLMVLFVISATNCDDEIDVGLPEIEPEATFTVDDARSWFDMNNVDIVMMKSNSGDALKSDVRAKQPQRVPFEADWSSAISTHKGHLEVVEANLLSTTILWYATKESKQKWKETNNPGYRGSLSRLVIIKNTKEDWVRSYIMTIIGETSYLESKKFNLASNTYLKKDSHFAGSILFHRLSGDYVNGWAMEKGKVTGKIIKNASNVSAKRSNEQVAFDMPDCTYYEVHELWEVCDIVPDYGGDGTLETIDESCYIAEGDLVDIFSVCVLSTEEPPYVGGTTIPPNLNNNLIGKAGCIFGKLESLGLFQETIANFVDNPEFDLNIFMGTCPEGADGCTDGLQSSDGKISITIAGLGNSSLEGAAIMLHEGIHAEMYRFVAAMEPNTDPNDRPELMRLYNHYGGFWDENNNPTGAQHYYMAANYVTPIARAIRQLDNNRYNLEYYMGYGWDGLRQFGYPLDLLTSAQSSDYYQKQGIVNSNSTFGDDCD